MKNGINMTGMPSFGSVGAEDKELWTIAAFVKKLPTVSDSDYKSWIAAPGNACTRSGAITATREDDMDKKFINPPELYKHPAYSRVITVKGPCKFIFIAGQTPSDENYQPVHPGDYRKQYEHIIKALTIQLTAAGATWDDVVVRRVFTLDVDALQKAMREPGVKHP